MKYEKLTEKQQNIIEQYKQLLNSKLNDKKNNIIYIKEQLNYGNQITLVNDYSDYIPCFILSKNNYNAIEEYIACMNTNSDASTLFIHFSDLIKALCIINDYTLSSRESNIIFEHIKDNNYYVPFIKNENVIYLDESNYQNLRVKYFHSLNEV